MNMRALMWLKGASSLEGVSDTDILESLNTKRRCKQVKFCCGCINGLGQRSFEVN